MPPLKGDCVPPLPVAEEGGTESPQPRLWRAVAKQARERHCGKVGQGGIRRLTQGG